MVHTWRCPKCGYSERIASRRGTFYCKRLAMAAHGTDPIWGLQDPGPQLVRDKNIWWYW